MSKQSFAELVKGYLKAAGYSQKILANELGVNSSVLSHKLNGTSHFILTYPEIRNIVLTLAKLEAITLKLEAQELLDLANCPGFSSEDWKVVPLKNLEEEGPKSFQGGTGTGSGKNFKRSVIQKNDNSFSSTATPLKTSLTNLPVQLTSFIGREKEIDQAEQLLSTTHLLTLAGAGGVGKTRLALQLGADLLDSFKDGIWLVELAPVNDPSLVTQVVSQVMELRAEASRPLSLTLVDYFKTRQALVILDNCEHLMEPCATLIMELLHYCPDLRILATSRETFEIAGETTYRVPSLSLPDFNSEAAYQPEVTFEQLNQFEAVRLFSERAVASKPGFNISQQNVSTIARICYRLDGIPLAIELAAARVSYLSVEQIMQHLDDRFRLLKGGSRSDLPRQQTLRALIDWSHSLLSQPEQVVLRRLAIFAGGWSLEAAEKVCAGEGVEEYEVLDYLIQLVKKSLVQAEDVSIGERVEVRYRMLETIRQYGLEKLKLAGEENRIQLKHLNYFLELSEEAYERLKGSEQIEWSNRLDQEQDNFRVAMAWTITNRLEELALRLAASTQSFWSIRCYWVEGLKWLEASLSLNAAGPGTFPGPRAKALYGAAYLASWLWDFEKATAFSLESLELYQSLDDKRGCAYARGNLVRIAYLQGDYHKALPLAQENLAELHRIGDKWRIGPTLIFLGSMAQIMGDIERAQQYYEEGLKLSNGSVYKGYSNTHQIGRFNEHLGILAEDRLELAQATRFYEESAKMYRQIGDKWGLASSLGYHGAVEMRLGNYKLSRILYEEAALLFRKMGNKSELANLLCRFGTLMLIEEKYSDATKLFKESLVICQEYILVPNIQGILATCLEGLAYLAWQNAKAKKAAQLIETAQTLRHKINLPLLPLEHMMKDRFIRVVKEQFGSSHTNYLSTSSDSQGSELSLEQAIDLALQEDFGMLP